MAQNDRGNHDPDHGGEPSTIESLGNESQTTLPEPQSCSSTPNTSVSDLNISTATADRQRHTIRLRTASRAIGLFRRAASSLSRGLIIGQMNKSASSSGDGKNCLSNTADEQMTVNGQRRSRKRRRSSTFKRLFHQNTSDEVLEDTRNSRPNNLNQVQFGSLLGNPRQQTLIVPRMNALKLPLKCLIKSLEGELMREVFVHRYELGQYLIENLKVSLGMNDCKYFGLRLAKSCDDQEDVKCIWLDLNESVCKQIKNKSYLSSFTRASKDNNTSTSRANEPENNTSRLIASCSRTIEFYLRIKFYPPNLTRIQDSFLRNYLWLQLRRDLRLGKLTSSMNNLAQLMACILQYEFGDFKQEHLERLTELNIMPNQDLVEDTAIDLWRTKLVNMKRHQALIQFLRTAIILETYGFDYYPVRDHQQQRAYLLGFNYAGIKTIRNGRIVHHFRWHSISKVSYERRMIIFHIYPTENSKRKQILGFKCMSNEDCQCLYMRLLEQKYFFTVDLNYFDKSIRRPSYLYSSPNESSQSVTDWTSNSIEAAQQQEQSFGNRPSVVQRASGSLDDPPTTSVSSTPECGGAYGCSDCCAPGPFQQPECIANLVRSATMPSEDSFDSDPMLAGEPRPSASTSCEQIRQRRAALARLHRQPSTCVSFSEATDAVQPSAWRQKLTDLAEQFMGAIDIQGGRQQHSTQSGTFRNIFWLNSSPVEHQSYLMPILKLILVILVANLVFRMTDSLSNALMAKLSFSSSSSSLTGTPQSSNDNDL